MICPKCNSKVDEKTKFCIVCGNNLNYMPFIDNANTQDSVAQVEGQEINLIDAYIGKRANKLKHGFSFCTLFLDVTYIFYRKMWGLGFLYIFLNLIISFLFPTYPILNFILRLFIACIFKKLYIKHVKQKVRQIVLENPGKDVNQLADICRKKGGTTFIHIIILISMIVIMILLAFVATFFTLNNITEKAQTGTNERSLEQYAKLLMTSYYEEKMSNTSLTLEEYLNQVNIGGYNVATSSYNPAIIQCENMLESKTSSGVNNVNLYNCTIDGRGYYNYVDGKAYYNSAE